MQQPTVNIEKILLTAQRLLENNMADAAQTILKNNGLKHTVKNGRIIDENDVTEDFLEKFITFHPDLVKVKNSIRKLAKTGDEVLICGPTGTGKELLANALHGSREGKFQTCNAAGLPENLIESELFGHVRGAFTGAHSDKIGLIMKAKNGTFFLDEIGELPLAAQGKLLRVLQEREIRKVGAADDEKINCRFVFATNRNIKKMCEEGFFRLDLYARISTFELHLLPMCLRESDVRPIIESLPHGKEFWEAYSKQYPDQQIPLPEMPFNVRSLQQYIKRYKVLDELPYVSLLA